MSSTYASYRPLPKLPPEPQGLPKPLPNPSFDHGFENIDILLPTGLIISILAPKRATLQSLKTQSFKEARNYPLFSLLKDSAFYNFVGITNDGSREEFVDEKRHFDDLELFQRILKLEERKGSQQEKLFNAELSNLIGARVTDFEVMGQEIRDFRKDLFLVCKSTVERRTTSHFAKLKYHYPSILEPSDELPPNLSKVYVTYGGRQEKKKNLSVSVLFIGNSAVPSKHPQRYEALVEVSVEAVPEDLIEVALQKVKQFSNINFAIPPHECVLKVIGREEYLVDRKPISQYKYLRSAMLKQSVPKLMVMDQSQLLQQEEEEFRMPSVYANLDDNFIKTQLHSFGPSNKEMTFISTWDVKPNFSIKIMQATHVNVTENHKLYVKCGLCYGAESLCESLTTRPQGEYQGVCDWNENIEFGISVGDLPRSAKLCFVLYSSRESLVAPKGKQKKKKGAQKEAIQIAWVNHAVFDYACNLNSGVFDVYMWPIYDELDDALNYMGSTVLNSAAHGTVCLKVELCRPRGISDQVTLPVMFPSKEISDHLADSVAQHRLPSTTFSKKKIEELESIVSRDPLAPMDEQDKELVWEMREYCLYELPRSLPKVLLSVSWNNHCEVSEMYSMLAKWQVLPAEKAMELLDYQYPDICVRDWAVDCLEHMNDNVLSKYLLQLVQVLKFELYLDTALGQFLLKRALLNKRIGHFLFWHLRSEMHLPAVSVRFGLMLEAYCRGCGAYREDLAKQFAALDAMKQISTTLQKAKEKQDQLKKIMHDQLKNPRLVDIFHDLRSPLDFNLQLMEVDVDKCKSMDSKMKPLWMVYKNADAYGSDVFEIFKQGDDLRQDMLTLQIIGIMDSLWHLEGLDMQMMPYGCLSTGDKIGVIEVVLNASTLAKIQKDKGGGATGAFKNSTLLEYLKEHNDAASLDQAIDVFTKSCAGYCVATYVLGIGDRHSDNIMLTKSGNLLHIDFGHFLGNFKSKFGVRRERVPFVLTNDFIFTIVKGDKNMESHKNFKEFKNLCERAFVILRRRGDLFINLFAMMLSTGIPELRSSDDVNYVREALCLGTTEAVAVDSFRAKFHEAVKNNTSVALNWYIHNLAKKQ
nr:phosphatidylinositol-4,5-bisphosphate 3-kinase catalytic subunit alpha/beta/delta [Halisarca dujardinii]